MEITFINSFSVPITINIGLAYLMSSIEGNHKLRLLDMVFHSRHFPRYVLDSLKEDRPDVVGFSVNSYNFSSALNIAKLIKQFYPDIPLVYGGVHPTLLPEETIRHPLVDAICIGEGEDSFREYLQRLQNHQEPRGVTGIWYKDKAGNIIKNPLRPFREDLDSLAFPNWDYWDIRRYLYTAELSFIGCLRVLVSRGCPYSCSFCSNPAIRKTIPGKFYRIRSPENVIKEIKHNREKYYKDGFRHIIFTDASFGVDIDNLRNLTNLFMREGLHEYFTWSCQTRVEVITEEWAKIVAEAGCIMVSLGIESGDENIRMNIYNKKFTNKQVYRALMNLRKYNISYYINIIIGCPEDSYKTINSSFDLLRRAKSLTEVIYFYHPHPKTELLKYIDKKILKEKVSRMFEVGTTHLSNAIIIDTKFLRVRDLKVIRFMIRINKIYKFFITGLRLKGLIFVVDIIKYIFHNFKSLSLSDSCTFTMLASKTVMRYIFEKQVNITELVKDSRGKVLAQALKNIKL